MGEASRREAVRAYCADKIAQDLSGSIANLGHAVGMGIAPSPEACLTAANRILDRISEAAFATLSSAEPGGWRELPAVQMTDDDKAAFQRVRELERKLQREERDHGLTVDQRDRAEKMADALADMIARITGAEIGEHSNLNCPWDRALSAAEDFLLPAPNPPSPENVG